jgi:hypothetical protein
MSWKDLYRQSVEQGFGGAQQLRQHCLVALKASARPGLQRLLYEDRSPSLFALCDALDQHEQPVTPAAIASIATAPDPPTSDPPRWTSRPPARSRTE